MNFQSKSKGWLMMAGLLIITVSCLAFAAWPCFSDPIQAEAVDQELPLVDTIENLQNLLQQAEPYYYYYSGDVLMPERPVMEAQTSDSKSAPAPVAGADYSATNVQVEGVDEADMIKTDGTYIYQVKGQQLNIIKAYPAIEMQVINSFSFSDPNFQANDIYVDNNYLVVMGTSYYHTQQMPRSAPTPIPITDAELCPPYYPYPYDIQTSKVLVYSLQDKAHLQKVREVELQGSMVSTRKIGSSVYLVVNRHFNWCPYQDGNPEIPLPAYKDSKAGSDFVRITPDKIHYFPDAIYPSYILMAALNLDDPNHALDIKTYLGNGENLYASLNNLYVAVSSYNYRFMPQTSKDMNSSSTSVYKFTLKPGATQYADKGSVPGTILNQFSMDESKDHFRIATTSDGTGADGMYTSQNNVYVLNRDMKITGRLENIAPGERIYSTRFMGDRAYMVTFRTVDPFFVIDLAAPENPKVLGQLKIPGYSDYLHPYDENHIIGFGKDTIELKGWNDLSQAYYQGMKLAIFDVTDVTSPKEIARELIGDRGTDSELLRNHKALLFARDKNLMAFPVTLMEVTNSYYPPGSPDQKLEYGSFAFQGAYIYNVDLQNGFRLKGRITHLTPDDYLKAGDYWYGSDKNISRILYIGNNIYTISGYAIMAHDLNDLSYINSIKLP